MNRPTRDHANYLVTDGGTPDQGDSEEPNEREDNEESKYWLAIAILFGETLALAILSVKIIQLLKSLMDRDKK